MENQAERAVARLMANGLAMFIRMLPGWSDLKMAPWDTPFRWVRFTLALTAPLLTVTLAPVKVT